MCRVFVRWVVVGWRIETGHVVHIFGASGEYAWDVGAVISVVCGKNFGHRKRCHLTIGIGSCTDCTQWQGKSKEKCRQFSFSDELQFISNGNAKSRPGFLFGRFSITSQIIRRTQHKSLTVTIWFSICTWQIAQSFAFGRLNYVAALT